MTQKKLMVFALAVSGTILYFTAIKPQEKSKGLEVPLTRHTTLFVTTHDDAFKCWREENIFSEGRPTFSAYTLNMYGKTFIMTGFGNDFLLNPTVISTGNQGTYINGAPVVGPVADHLLDIQREFASDCNGVTRGARIYATEAAQLRQSNRVSFLYNLER
jgi:hypothetical protein